MSSTLDEVRHWGAWVLDTLGWTLALWVAFGVLMVWVLWMLTKDNQ